MKFFRVAITFLLLFSCQISGQVTDSVKFKSLSPYYFHLNYLKEEHVLMVDVREFFEYRGRRIKDAINIPSTGNLEFSADTIDKNVTLFLYCTTDYRSIRAARFFAGHGFSKVYSLEGGIVAWRKEGFPVEKKRVKRKK